MPSVDLSLIGKKSEPFVFDYTWKDVALYALGVGASSDELPLVYEGVPGGIRVLPSFCVVPAYQAFPDLGPDIEWSLMLHGEQTIRLYGPFPPEGRLVQVGEVEAIHDKGKGAVFHVKVSGKTERRESPLRCPLGHLLSRRGWIRGRSRPPGRACESA